MKKREDSFQRSLTLSERIYYFKNAKKVISNRDNKNHFKWLNQQPFDDPVYLNKFLSSYEISEKEFQLVLSQKFLDIKTYTKENEKLKKIFTNLSIVKKKKNEYFSEKYVHINKLAGFFDVINPLIIDSKNKLRKSLDRLILKQINFSPNTLEKILSENLPARLFELLNKTMVLELSVERIKGNLKGITSEDRLNDFLERLKDVNYSKYIFEEYPILIRQSKIYLDDWIKNSLTIIKYLIKDKEELKEIFNIDINTEVISNIEFGKGDRHRGGKTVTIIEFLSGKKLIYKPRSLAIDKSFQKFIDWLNFYNDSFKLKSIKTINNKTYGWIEYIENEKCSTTQEISNYYEKLGAFLTILYTLNATDFHFENIIACGEDPFLIDLETFFHPEFPETSFSQSILNNTVLASALLPNRIYENEEDKIGINISGMFSVKGEMSTNKNPVLKNYNSDLIEINHEKLPFRDGKNVPVINNKEVNPKDFLQFFLKGFVKAYTIILENRNDLLKKGGILSDFANNEVRVLFRNSSVYGKLLGDTTHPNLLKNGVDRDLHLNLLWNATIGKPYLEKIIQFEIQSLNRSDLPYFTTRPNSKHLWCNSTKKLVNFFDKSSLSIVRDKIKGFNQDDLEKQILLISASITGNDYKSSFNSSIPSYNLKETNNEVKQEVLINNAITIGNRLISLAYKNNNKTTWLRLHQRRNSFNFSPCGLDLYGGISGIVLYLAYLGNITKRKEYTLVAKQATKSIVELIDNKMLINSIGAFGGWGGVIYTLSHLIHLWNDEQLNAKTKTVLEIIDNLIDEDKEYDIIYGSAGCILSLISLYKVKSTNEIKNLAIRCGEQLIKGSIKMNTGIGWKISSEKPLSGFSHGAAGISYALFELYLLTKIEKYKDYSIEALKYERSLYSFSNKNWLDLRNINNGKSIYMTTWGHGAPGIGMSRIQFAKYMNDIETRKEIEVAIETTLKNGFGKNHSLINGDLGNIELLLLANGVFKKQELKKKTYCLANSIIKNIEESGCKSSNILWLESCDLMTGISGIGYSLLRLAFPKHVPSVLILNKPL